MSQPVHASESYDSVSSTMAPIPVYSATDAFLAAGPNEDAADSAQSALSIISSQERAVRLAKNAFNEALLRLRDIVHHHLEEDTSETLQQVKQATEVAETLRKKLVREVAACHIIAASEDTIPKVETVVQGSHDWSFWDDKGIARLPNETQLLSVVAPSSATNAAGAAPTTTTATTTANAKRMMSKSNAPTAVVDPFLSEDDFDVDGTVRKSVKPARSAAVQKWGRSIVPGETGIVKESVPPPKAAVTASSASAASKWGKKPVLSSTSTAATEQEDRGQPSRSTKSSKPPMRSSRAAATNPRSNRTMDVSGRTGYDNRRDTRAELGETSSVNPFVMLLQGLFHKLMNARMCSSRL